MTSTPATRRYASVQKVWGWKIAAYLFLAGAGAGSYAVGSAAVLWSGVATRSARILFMQVGAAVVVLSVLFLVWDLGRPIYFLRAIRRPLRSWLSRGSWILIGFVALAAATLLSGAPAPLTAISLISALAVAAYTGLLMGTMLARPLWNSPALPVLYVISAVSTGIGLAVLAGIALGSGHAAATGMGMQTGQALRAIHIAILVSELVVLYLYLQIASARARASVDLLLRGPVAVAFWAGVIGVGLVVPLALISAETATPSTAARAALEISAECGVLIGGYLLRRVILAAGVRSPVYLGAGSVPFVIRQKV